MAIVRAVVFQPYLLLTLTAFMWAGNAIAGKLAVGHVSPFLLTSLRWAIALCILLPFAGKPLRRDWRIVRANMLFLFLLGAVGFTFFNNLFYVALTYTTTINVAIIQSSIPLFVFFLGFLAFGQRIGVTQIAGFLLTLLGVAVTVTGGNPLLLVTSELNVGDLLMVVAAICYAGYSVALVKRPKLHWLTFITVLAAAALMTSIPFTLVEWWDGKIIGPDTRGWFLIAYIGLFPSIVAQLFWVRGLELIGANRGGVFINFVPVFTVLLAIALLGEKLMLFHIVALALVSTGVWMAQKQVVPQTPVS